MYVILLFSKLDKVTKSHALKRRNQRCRR